jgi:hypothetical protein
MPPPPPPPPRQDSVEPHRVTSIVRAGPINRGRAPRRGSPGGRALLPSSSWLLVSESVNSSRRSGVSASFHTAHEAASGARSHSSRDGGAPPPPDPDDGDSATSTIICSCSNADDDELPAPPP